MARNPDILQGTAPSPFDEHPTLPFEGFDDSAVSEAGEGTSADTGETVGAAPDAAVTEWKDKKTVDLVYEGVRRRLDVPWDVVKVMGQLNRKHETTAMSPDPLEEELLKLGSAELYLSQKRQELREFDPATAADPAGKVGEVQAFIDKVLPSTPEDQRDKFEKDKEILAYLTAPDEFKQETEQLRETAASEFYSKATDDAYPDIKPEMKKLQELTKRETLEAKALETLHAYLPKLGEIPETEEPEQVEQTEEIGQARVRLKELEQQLGLLYAKREQKSKLDFSMRREANQQLLADYRAASNKVFMLENAAMLDDPHVSEEEKIEAVALHTLKQGRALEEAKLQQDGRTRFRRVIHKLGEQISKHPYITGLVSLTGGVLLSTVTAGAAAGVTAGALAYIKAEHMHQKKRESRDKQIHDNEDATDDLYDSLVDVVGHHYDNTENYRLDKSAIAEMLEHGHQANEAKFEGRMKQEQWRRMGTFAIAGAVGGIGWLGAHHFGFDQNNWGGDTTHAAPGTPATPGPDVPHAPDLPAAPEVPAHTFAPGTFTAHPGDGYYDILQRMGVPAADRHDVLASVTKELSKYSYFQPGDPLPRIPRPGSLPQGAIDILTKAVSR